MKIFYPILLCFFFIQQSSGQIYMEKQTRHRFAQLNLGLDYQTNFGGKTFYLDEQSTKQTLSLGQLHKARFLIGGTHFWGHADFYVAIPLLYPSFEKNNQNISFTSSIETVFKYYPLRIQHNKIRPFIGLSLAPFFFEQDNNNFEYGNGSELSHTSIPILTGFTFNAKSHLLELGLTWNYANKQDYYISRNDIEQITTPPLYLNLSYRYMLETTASAERAWESGHTATVTQQLAEQNRLNAFYIGAGISSAFWNGKSSYNEMQRPYIPKYGISLMPDFTLGYYFHKADLNIAANYRSYGTTANTYGSVQSLRRRSIGIEATKFLFDYHGFVPFLGPVLTYEQLSFEENFENQILHDLSDNKMGYGLTFGWDIRPNRLQAWILRTNLRWFPNLKLDVENDQSISFNNIEFNFIQLIIYPNRMFKKKTK